MTKEHAINWIRKSVDKNSRLWKAIEALAPDITDSEDERIRKGLISYLEIIAGDYFGEFKKSDIIAYLEKQKEQTEDLSTRLNGVMQEYVKAGEDEEEQEHRLKCYQLFWDALGDSEFFKQKEQKSNIEKLREISTPADENWFEIQKKWENEDKQKPILEVFGFKVGDAVRLKDGDGRKHIIKSFKEVEGLHGPNFYHVEFEDNSARDGIYPGKEYPNGYYTQMEKLGEEQKSSDEYIRRNSKELHALLMEKYDEGFWKGKEAVLKEQNPIAHENNCVSKPKTSVEILKHYLVWAENSEEDCPYTWKELAAAIKDGISALEQKPVEYLSKRKVYDIMNKLTELSTSDLIPIKSEEYVKIHEITSDVCSLLDYPIEQNHAENPFDANETMKMKDRIDEGFTKMMMQEQKPAEWSEEDEKILSGIEQCVYDNVSNIGTVNKVRYIDWLKSFRPQPHKEIYQAAKHDLAIRFMNYLDENRPEGKMCLSNGECEDIDKAFKKNDWAKIIRYINKYSWKPSEEQMEALEKVLHRCPETIDTDKAKVLWELFDQLRKLK